nr:hypothetical protein TQ38_24050 [Novosphingobium sp. P6W]
MRWSEAIWAVTGAALLLVLGLMPIPAVIGAVGQGLDVYLFPTGMMLLSEVARKEGLFDWVAATAAIHFKGSSARLLALLSLAAVGVTFVVLRWTQRRSLSEPCEWDVPRSPQTMAGKAVLAGIVGTAILLIVTSARCGQLGLPIAIAGILTAVTLCALARRSPGGIAYDVFCGSRRSAVRGKTSDSGVSSSLVRWRCPWRSRLRSALESFWVKGTPGPPGRAVFCFRIEP